MWRKMVKYKITQKLICLPVSWLKAKLTTYLLKSLVLLSCLLSHIQTQCVSVFDALMRTSWTKSILKVKNTL